VVEDAPPVTAMWLYLSHVAFKHTRTRYAKARNDHTWLVQAELS